MKLVPVVCHVIAVVVTVVGASASFRGEAASSGSPVRMDMRDIKGGQTTTAINIPSTPPSAKEASRRANLDEEDLKQFLAIHNYGGDQTLNQLYVPNKLHRFGWMVLKGTLFNNKHILIQFLILGLLSFTSGAIGWNFSDGALKRDAEHLEDAMHAVITFFMGLFISNVYGRWYDMFMGPYGAVWGAITSMAVYGNWYLGGPNKSKVLLTHLRWGLLSHALLFKDGSKEADMDDLVARRLATPEEAAMINDVVAKCPKTSRAKIPWAWVGESIMRAYEAGESQGSNVDVLHGICRQATGGIGAIGGTLGQKLPFPYVHLLTFMAKFNMIIMSITRGISVASHIKYGLLSGDPSLSKAEVTTKRFHAVFFLIIDLLRMLFLPLVYQGCFELNIMMFNPFDRSKKSNPVAFPELFYHMKILSEAVGLMTDNPSPSNYLIDSGRS